MIKYWILWATVSLLPWSIHARPSQNATGNSELSFPEGIWVGEYSCRGRTLPLMVEFEAPGKPASVAFVQKRKKMPQTTGEFHASLEVVKTKKGQTRIILRPKYWLKNPGNTAMFLLRGQQRASEITGLIKKKGCKQFSLRQLPCGTVPAACGPDALGSLHALLGTQKQAAIPSVPKAPSVPGTPGQGAHPSTSYATNHLPALNDNRFNVLLGQMRDEPFLEGQLVVLNRFGSQYRMTSQQVATILKMQRFSSDKLAALKTLAPNISDLENVAVVLDVMRFRTERTSAEKIIFDMRRRRQPNLKQPGP